jgi:hypothetical protein
MVKTSVVKALVVKASAINSLSRTFLRELIAGRSIINPAPNFLNCYRWLQTLYSAAF